MQSKWVEGKDELNREIYNYDGGFIASFLYCAENKFISIGFTAPQNRLPSFKGIRNFPLIITYLEKENFLGIFKEVDKLAPFPPDLKDKIKNQIVMSSQDPLLMAKELSECHRNLEFEQALILIQNFLTHKKELLPPFTHSDVASELLSIISSPEKIDQQCYKLCGVDIFLRELAIHSPHQFACLAIKLAEKGYSSIPFAIHMPQNLDEPSITLAMMIAIKHTSNRVIGYHPQDKFKFFSDTTGLDWEEFGGDTYPKELEFWFNASGFSVLSDDMKIFTSNWREIHWMSRFAAGGIYSSIHEDIDGEKRIERLQQYVENKKIGINLLISMALTEFMTKSITVNEVFEKSITSSIGYQKGHYVKLNKFFVNKDGSLNLELNTWGDLYQIENLPREIFARHCFGSFVTLYQNPTLHLDESIVNNRHKP